MSTVTVFPSDSLSAFLQAQNFGHVVDGHLEVSADAERYPVLNPATGELIVEVPLGTREDVHRSVRVARGALAGWRSKTPGQRATHLLALAALIDEHADILAELESLNVGKPLPMARDEMSTVSDLVRFIAGAVRTVQTPAAEEYVEGHVSMIRREPLGVVGAITPWNYPLTTAMFKIAPALAAGNTIVLKPSELTPLTTVVFADMAQAVLPPGVLNVVIGTGPDVGQSLAEHPGVDAISLTGSINSGVTVAREGAETLKRVHLELGGKAPVIVFEDADIDAAVDTIRTAGFWNAGQECGAATRVLCAEKVSEELIEKLRLATSELRLAGPDRAEDPQLDIGPLISENQRRRVDGIVEGAIRDGASAVIGGAPAEQEGFFYQPTVLANVAEGAEVTRVEIFGPVVTVETFDDEEEVLRRANDSRYGLSASVWTESTRRALRVTEALEYGTVWVNAHLILSSEVPWTGFGMSGIGRECSIYSLDDFSRVKHVMLAK
ncbi:MAG TPA: aldehyde dehydrogenase family protein [Solirubrobacteraceae bacterium]|nr:aldehyde dehydrogenase family protein [Solirubrobacteraceae bacterium]